MTAMLHAMPIITRTANARYLAFKNFCLAFLKANQEAVTDKSQIKNPDITGIAICIHGYAALPGFGITLIKNHIVERIETIKNTILAGILIRFKQ